MILIVDDERFALSLMLRKLEKYGLSLLTTTTVDSAVEIISNYPDIELVITDLHMPGNDGFYLINWLNENKPAIKIIVATAHSTELTAELASKGARYDKVLTKPISVDDELIPVIKELIEGV